jgi:hypothetical protein
MQTKGKTPVECMPRFSQQLLHSALVDCVPVADLVLATLQRGELQMPCCDAWYLEKALWLANAMTKLW